MNESRGNFLEPIIRSRSLVEQAFAPQEATPACAQRLAELLPTLWPFGTFYFCRLQDPGPGPALAVLGSDRQPLPRLAEALQPLLSNGPPSDLPTNGALAGQLLVAEPLGSQNQPLGLLGVGLQREASKEVQLGLRALVSACAGQISAHLDAQQKQQEAERLQQELLEQAHLAQIGELAGPVAHESNNFLNVITLQLAILEPDMPAHLHSQLAKLRNQVGNYKSLIHQFQSRRSLPQAAPGPVDLNRVVQRAVDDLSRLEGTPQRPAIRPADKSIPDPGGIGVRLHLTANLPPVLGRCTDLRRLVTFLLADCAHVLGRGLVDLETEATPAGILLRVKEDRAPTSRPSDSLEWVAVQSLLLRLRGSANREMRSGAGMETVVQLPTA